MKIADRIWILIAPILFLTSPLLAIDDNVVSNLRWRTSDSAATQRYFWILLAAGAICVAIWLTYTLGQRVSKRIRRSRRQPRHPRRPVTVTPMGLAAVREAGPPQRVVKTPNEQSGWKPVAGVEASAKARAVIRLIQGEDVDEVATEVGVTTALLRDWVERFVRAGRQALEPESSWSP